MFKITGLATGYTYRIELRAETIAGEGSASSLSAITCDTPPPVHRFRIASRSEVSTRFEWDRPLFATHCPILGYVLFGGTSASSLVKIGSTSSESLTSFEYTHAAADQEMYYQATVRT
jgi:hypothetical protein